MSEFDHFESALNVQEGIEQPEQVSPYLHLRKKRARTLQPADYYVQGILEGNRVILSQAITLIESVNPTHFQLAQEVIEKCLPYAGKSVRVGITGVPGVGKSTFIEAIGKYLTGLGLKLAVLAIDPSSERSKGSILGDKTRMEELSVDKNAYIRPSPSGSTLGGVARKTRETIVLCEAAGFNVIFVETVGVGQSETVVKSMVDFFLLLQLAGAGDELQGIKRGIMEMADAIVITKADGDNYTKAVAATALYRSALKLFPPLESQWTVPVGVCSSTEKTNIEQVWKMVEEFVNHTQENGFFHKQRTEQLIKIFYDWMDYSLKDSFYSDKAVEQKIEEMELMIKEEKMTPYQAASQVMAVSKEKV